MKKLQEKPNSFGSYRHLKTRNRAGYGIRYGLSWMLLLGSCLGISCHNTAENDPGDILLRIVIPENQKTIHQLQGKATEPGTADESRISTLTFFVFNATACELYKNITINNDNTSSDPMWDPTLSTLRLTVTPGAKRIYAIANWTATSPEMPDLTPIADSATLLSTIRVHNGVTPTNPPVMTGRLQTTLTGSEQHLRLDLTRQVTRVDLYPLLSTSVSILGNVTIEGVRFMQLAQRAYLFPRSPGVSPATGVWDQPGFTGASMPVTTTAAKYGGPFYIPEFYGNSTLFSYMVIRAKYNGTDTYYSIPVNGHTGALPAQYAVQRNYIYAYYVTIQGLGSDAPVVPVSGNFNLPAIANIEYKLEIK